MSKIITLVSMLYLSILTNPVVGLFWCNSQCFKMADTKVMTFMKGKYVTSPNGKKFSEIYCAEGNACHLVNKIEAIQCVNMGVDHQGKINWKCDTVMAGNDLIIGYTNPTCRGYRSTDDNEYAYKNSCLVMVKLDTIIQQTQQTQSVILPNDSYESNYIAFYCLFSLLIILMIYICLTQKIIRYVNTFFDQNIQQNQPYVSYTSTLRPFTNPSVTIINNQNSQTSQNIVNPHFPTNSYVNKIPNIVNPNNSNEQLRKRIVSAKLDKQLINNLSDNKQHTIETVGKSDNLNHPFNDPNENIQHPDTTNHTTIKTVGKSDNKNHPFGN